MFRKTGPGLIEVDSAYTGAGVLKALLYNFDFDDSDVIKHNELKVEFTRFLADRVAPLLTDGKGQIWMRGSASRIGDERWNMELSENRVGRVYNFLMAQGVSDSQMQLKAVGEELAKPIRKTIRATGRFCCGCILSPKIRRRRLPRCRSR